jgi:hypothetical protein
MHFRRLLPLVALGVLLALFCLPNATLAHEHRTIAAGKYDVVVGWDTEPPYVNEKNAAGVRISKAGTNPAQPVTGAETTLKIQIRQGAQTRTFDLRPVVAQPGYYVADIVPTRAGGYIWTLIGSIGPDQVNETFNTADGKFDAVATDSDVQFPVAAPDPDQVSAQLQTADAAVERAQNIAYIGVALGAVGCLAAILLWLTRPRGSPTVLSSRDAPVRRVRGAGL